MQEVAGVTSSNDRLGPTRVACWVIFAMRANMRVASAVAPAAEVGVSGQKKMTRPEATSLIAWSFTLVGELLETGADIKPMACQLEVDNRPVFARTWRTPSERRRAGRRN